MTVAHPDPSASAPSVSLRVTAGDSGCAFLAGVLDALQTSSIPDGAVITAHTLQPGRRGWRRYAVLLAVEDGHFVRVYEQPMSVQGDTDGFTAGRAAVRELQAAAQRPRSVYTQRGVLGGLQQQAQAEAARQAAQAKAQQQAAQDVAEAEAEAARQYHAEQWGDVGGAEAEQWGDVGGAEQWGAQARHRAERSALDAAIDRAVRDPRR